MKIHHEVIKEKSILQNKMNKGIEKLLDNKYENYFKNIEQNKQKIEGILHNFQAIANELEKKEVKRESFEILKGNIRNYLIGVNT